MKTIMQNLLLVTSFAVFACSSCSVSSHAEKASGVDLSKYKTFSWTTSERKSKASSEIVDNNIKEIVTEQLENKGLSQSDKSPDLILDYSVTLPSSARPNRPTHGRMGGQVFMGGRSRTSVYLQPGMMMNNRNRQSSTGTLTINMLDANTKKLVWQGWVKDDMNSRTITTKQVKSEVKAIFKKFDNE